MTSVRRNRENPIPGTGDTRARYRRILGFAAWHLAVTWWFELFLPRIGLVRIAERTRTRRMRRFAQRFHVLAMELGGLMIKVGQFLSSRLDVLPPEITAELEGLQDEVPPATFPAIRGLAEAELGAPLNAVFASVEEVPIAAASLGQAHGARLLPGNAADTGLDNVVLKVQRPGIHTIVDVDLAALRKVGGWLSHVRFVSNRANVPALVEEFAKTSLEEIDYLNEAANAERFAADFADDMRVTVPGVVWVRTRGRVLPRHRIPSRHGLRAAVPRRARGTERRRALRCGRHRDTDLPVAPHRDPAGEGAHHLWHHRPRRAHCPAGRGIVPARQGAELLADALRCSDRNIVSTSTHSGPGR